MSTSIKRLKQNGTEFVPITLAEAVVVNGKYIWGNGTLDIITTLDNVLRILYGKDANLDLVIQSLNTLISNKLDTLIPGEGISINVVDGKTIISSSQSLYTIVTELPTPSKECLNKIYLVGNSEGQMVEYICVESSSGGYYFEQIGLIQVQEDIDLSGYITTERFNLVINPINSRLTLVEGDVTNIKTDISNIKDSMLTAVEVTTSGGNIVSVNYEIPKDLFDSAANTDGDNIV